MIANERPEVIEPSARIHRSFDDLFHAVETVMAPRTPSPDPLLARVRELAREQPTMTFGELYRHELGRALLERFASVADAIERAGVANWPVRALHDAMSRDDVVRALATGRRGAADPRLQLGIARHFDTLDAALAAADRGARTPATRTRWTRDEVVRRLDERRAAGSSLQASVVAREARTLYDAAVRFFGSYAEAARKFGVPAKVEWTEDAALSAIRRLAKRRRALASRDVPSGLRDACKRLFGSWEETCRRAGVTPARSRARRG